MEEKSTNITSNTAGDNSTVTTGRNVSSPVFGSYGSEIGFFSIFITLRYHIDYFKGVYRGLLDGRVLNRDKQIAFRVIKPEIPVYFSLKGKELGAIGS